MGYIDETGRGTERAAVTTTLREVDEPMQELPRFTRLDRFDEAQSNIDHWCAANGNVERTNIDATSLSDLVSMLHTAEGLAAEHRARAGRIDEFVDRIRERMHIAANETAQDAVRGAEVRDYR